MKQTIEPYLNILQELRCNPLKNDYYSQYLATKILQDGGYNNNYIIATPICTIIRELGGDVLQSSRELKKSELGGFCVNGPTKERYGHDWVILCSKHISLKEQYYMAAHELACFLLKYMGSEYENKKDPFCDCYSKKGHSCLKNSVEEESIVSKFVDEILMPREKFCMQYLYAVERGSYLYTGMGLLDYLSDAFNVEPFRVKKRIKVLFNETHSFYKNLKR